jgi:nucleoside-diphosphate-sugar epimerase
MVQTSSTEMRGCRSLYMDPYNETKAMAEEMVLEANGKRGLLTVVLRPTAIFGSAMSLLFEIVS